MGYLIIVRKTWTKKLNLVQEFSKMPFKSFSPTNLISAHKSTNRQTKFAYQMAKNYLQFELFRTRKHKRIWGLHWNCVFLQHICLIFQAIRDRDGSAQDRVARQFTGKVQLTTHQSYSFNIIGNHIFNGWRFTFPLEVKLSQIDCVSF